MDITLTTLDFAPAVGLALFPARFPVGELDHAIASTIGAPNPSVVVCLFADEHPPALNAALVLLAS